MQVITLSTATGLLPLPEALLDRLMNEGAACLRVLLLDGQVIATGGFPDWLSVVEIVGGRPAAAS